MELEEIKKKKTSRLFLLRVFIYILGLFFRLQRDSTRQSGLEAGWLEFESQSKLCVCVCVCEQLRYASSEQNRCGSSPRSGRKQILNSDLRLRWEK